MDERMMPEDCKRALLSMRHNVETQMVGLGQLLYDVKTNNHHGYYGFNTFTDYIESHFNMPGSFANKLIRIFKQFSEKMQLDETTIVGIGIDKLSLILPIIKKVDAIEQDVWIEKATDMTIGELKEEVELYKEKHRKLNIEDVFTDQFVERMVTDLNCSKKKLMYNLAVYFHYEDHESVCGDIAARSTKIKEDGIPSEKI